MSEKLRRLNDKSDPIAIVFRRLPTQADISQWEPLQTIDYLHRIMERMPEGKTGLVLGSGQNTFQWKQRGWLTLDIDPRYQTDFILDANHLESISQNQFDFILAENITFNPTNQYGVSPDCLLDQANKSLKKNGYLIIQSTHLDNISSSLPNKYEYPQLMLSQGFKTIVEVDNSRNFNNGKQTITYYGKKDSQV